MKKHGQQFTPPVDFTGKVAKHAQYGAVRHPSRQPSSSVPPLALDESAAFQRARETFGVQWPLMLPHGIDGPVDAWHALARLVRYHDADLYPPLSVLDWLAAGIEAWFEADGKRTLDQCLGLTGGRGKTNAQALGFRAVVAECQKEERMLEMFQLITIFNVSPENAAAMVAARLADTPEGDQRFEASSLVIWWYSAPGAVWRDTEFNEGLSGRGLFCVDQDIAALRATSVADRRARLARYPRSSFEHLKIDPVDSD